MAKKSISEKVMDIFIGTIARDMSKTALKKAKEMFAEKASSRKKLRRNTEEPEAINPELEP
jgi:hypothetical protein